MGVAGTARHEPTGRTLVEGALTVVILEVLAALARPGLLGGRPPTGVEGATRQLPEDIRGAQTRLIVFDQCGSVPEPGNLTDRTRANQYRIERRTGPAARGPALTDDPRTNPNALTGWHDLGTQDRGVAVTTGRARLFNPQGFLVSSLTPVTTSLQGPGGSQTVQTTALGRAAVR
jgi:Tfp pilus assembly protein FimT